MSVKEKLQERSDNQCELCKATENLEVYIVSPKKEVSVDTCALLCNSCKEQIEDPEKTKSDHWRCLAETMWSEAAAVKVLAWRILTRLKDKGWPQNLLDLFYMDDETAEWAKDEAEFHDNDIIKHLDSNGAILNAGDNVVLIKDLNVKGTSFTAKRGTVVRNISLDRENSDYIDGKVNGQHIVILTRFVKKN